MACVALEDKMKEKAQKLTQRGLEICLVSAKVVKIKDLMTFTFQFGAHFLQNH